MHMTVKARVLLLAVMSLIVSSLPHHAAEWEDKPKYHYLPDAKPTLLPGYKGKALLQLRKSLLPERSIIEIEPALENRITAGRGTLLKIAVNAFADERGRPVAARVRLTITEVIDPLDFVGAGVDLTYTNDQGNLEFFKSAGMFKVDAETVAGQRVQMAAGKKIEVQFPNIERGDDFWVYRHNKDKQWKLHGHNQSFQGEGPFRVGTRVYQIDALNTWFNFDKPVPEATCAKGSVKRKDGNQVAAFAIYSVGVSYKGAFARHVNKSSSFKVNVHKSAQARFLVLDNTGAVGITPVIRTSDKTGFDQAEEGAKNFCQNIGEIEIAPVPADILSDKTKLSNYLGLPVSEFSVDYQTPASDKR
ncbi:hypothetical protein [Turneriella parva]|uniref:Uncharacterized protein n=1 Tax=Turneriella parva (strain ATCC BAA-1111 / DSM 21527 / NCTC 11395 / H) TaxID=869212 RepID=I4B723_TURPD|nr:hypothetical protein [Turneriella parva]AFM13080.1 hypothetical protein Turpa_2438 [Turneriella parva DSM 21527]